MINEFLLYLPCSISLALVLILGICGKQTKSYGQIMLLFIAAALYFYTDACYSYKGIDYNVLSYTSLLSQLVTPCLLPLSWMYLMTLQGTKPGHSMSAFWIIAPVFLFSCASMLDILNGFDNEILFIQVDDKTVPISELPLEDKRMYDLSSFFKTKVFRVVLFAELVVMLIFIIQSWIKTKLSFKKYHDFIWNGGSMSPFHIQLINFCAILVIVAIKIVLQRSYLIQHQGVAVILAIVTTGLAFVTGMVCMFSGWDQICLSDMSFNLPRSYQDDAEEMLVAVKEKGRDMAAAAAPSEATATVETPEAPVETVEERPETPEPEPTGTTVRTPVIPTVQPTGETTVNTVLLGKFEDLIINRQLFLTPGLTINDIATKLGTNRTYISQLVNDNYHMPFPDFLNNLRIDYAEQYILHNREAKQNEVAQACGFPSASSFNVTFKKITGVTPRIWLATYADNN